MPGILEIIFLLTTSPILDVDGFSTFVSHGSYSYQSLIMPPLPMFTTSSKFEYCIGDTKYLEQSFDTMVWEEYEAMVATVKDKVRLSKNNKNENFAPSIQYLISRELAVEPLDVGKKFEKETIDKQREKFIAETNLTSLQYNYVMKVLTYMGHYCAKLQKSKHLAIAWRKVLESGMAPYQPTINTYMYVLSLDEETSQLSGEAATYHDMLFDPNETSITIKINCLMSAEDASGAEMLLEKMPSNDFGRLRTYQPILHYYCNKGDMSAILRLYRQMSLSPGVHLDADTYTSTIGCLAENGGFQNDIDPISSAVTAGFSNTHGPRLFDELSQEMADDILELTNSSVRILYNALFSGFRESLPPSAHPISSHEDIMKSANCAESNETILSRVTVNKTTAFCPCSRTQLKLYKLEQDSRKNVCRTLFSMAKEQFEEYNEKRKLNKKKYFKKQSTSFVEEELNKFCSWIEEKGPFTAIIDGANVGYYGHGTIRYSQIWHVMKKLEEMNETPLVVMPLKYTRPEFYVSRGNYQKLEKKAIAFLKELENEGKLYIVPPGCLDDYFWMIASVTGKELSVVDADNNSGRFPGNRPMLITNDQMRDHRLALLEPRLFRRWYSCHIVNYDFSKFYEKEWEERKVDFCAADVFSNEIQGNPSQDEKILGSLSWHFPVEGWGKHDRLCIRIN
mmetsp:Transcript_18129/g.20922  ORF Transcript_18129/g.20922 Transcript_18129/m.20922 type:complete len:679 (-) Transcript_18129:48-2084(-)